MKYGMGPVLGDSVDWNDKTVERNLMTMILNNFE